MGRCARKMMASVDETDRAILSALRENSRQAFVELAKIVGVSERTIRTRVRPWKRMESFVATQFAKRESD
ncbi:MAG: hypothetical protein Ct9H90mP16_16930 [Candidatus Poseidoniales archaeon]|nr:MAG: hypothetical protein Ct9H90mP16_16930 [Candidatus Poseidoniales archaeon]